MTMLTIRWGLCWWVVLLPAVLFAAPVQTVDELKAAVAAAQPGAVVTLAAGRFELAEPLDLPGGVTLEGQGVGQTTMTHTAAWKANPATLPDPETDFRRFDRTGYLLRCKDDAEGITVRRMSFTGPQVHGAIFGFKNARLHFQDLHLQDFMYCGIRTYMMTHAVIEDCVFVDVGKRWERGQLGIKGGITGGAIFAIWFADCEIKNNRFSMTSDQPGHELYGIKGRQAKRVHIHHNTIGGGFSIELPFENDEDVVIDHNICRSAISIPKYAGGPVPPSGRTFHIHHNFFQDTYSIEFVRNGVEIDHNLFDFKVEADHGNLISAFGSEPAKGPARFHNNLVSNPGRGVIWMNEPYAQLEVRNNHIIARPTKNGRTDGLFGFHAQSDFRTFRFIDNHIECEGQSRPLFRNKESGGATVENNRLVNVSDQDRYPNRKADRPVGLEQPLKFVCGMHGELTVDGWTARPTSR